ncbi:tetratricopeptide repeat protein [Pseudonocardia adelaidensis]|uniref:tetratricopeptide repeat protein n=1 Tax=Pseudonocardia adelaidensis TaxID=648754 RepID=UPI0031F0D946
MQAVRRQLGYSAAKTIAMLERQARADQITIMTSTSLKTKLSRWENGHESVGLPEYRRLFREIYGRTNAELGFPDERTDRPADELRDRIAVARMVDSATVAALHGQIEQARVLDRQFGGVHHLDQLRHQIAHMQELLAHLPAVGQRAALAGALTEASALAGWQALDREDHTQAWAHHERAKQAAREAGSPLLLAHATAQKTVILLALDDTAPAVDQAAYARSIATGGPALMRAWLAAKHGETLAAAGDRDAALRAFDDAYGLLPADPVDPALPFLFLGGAHLDRWRGNALALVGDAEALDQLTAALARLPPTWARARSRLLVDLAYAHAAAGDRDAALGRAREARAIARQISSDHQLRRLDRLVLPQGRPA